ncbi:unnamed protein product [Effrenium voratum]|nr:unnamed protein product [Effrenium voratum]
MEPPEKKRRNSEEFAFWDFEVSKACVEDKGDLLLLDPSKSRILGDKASLIMKLTGATQLVIKEGRICVAGARALKLEVAKYADIIVNELVPPDYAGNNMLRIFVSESFASRWGGSAEVEKAEGVLIVVERRQEVLQIQVGDLVEVAVQRGVWSMASVAALKGTRATVRHTRDLRREELPIQRVRLARSVAILGASHRRRLAAALNITAQLEEECTGALGALHENPHLKGHNLGVISQELPVPTEVLWRLEKSPYLAQIQQAVGCSIKLFTRPPPESKASARKLSAVPCVLVAGNLEERWKGMQIVKTIAMGMGQKRHPALPNALLGDSRTVTIPKDILSVVVGKQMSSLLQLMKSTKTVIFPLKEKDRDMDKLLDMMIEDEEEMKCCDIAILGDPSARSEAEVKVRSLVEKHHPGFANQDVHNQAVGMGVEKLTLEGELEQLEERSQLAQQLAGATGCLVEFAATSAFVAGTQPARALCQEYISFVNHGLRSHVHGLKMRADTATRPKVPRAVAAMPWLQQQLAKLALGNSTVTFFDMETAAGENETKRLVFAGNVLALRPGVGAGLVAQANALIQKAQMYQEENKTLEECLQAEVDAKKDEAEEVKAVFGAFSAKGKGNEGKGKDKGKGKGKDKGKGEDRWEDGTKHEDEGDKGKGDGKGKKGEGQGKGYGKGKGKIIFTNVAHEESSTTAAQQTKEEDVHIDAAAEEPPLPLPQAPRSAVLPAKPAREMPSPAPLHLEEKPRPVVRVVHALGASKPPPATAALAYPAHGPASGPTPGAIAPLSAAVAPPQTPAGPGKVRNIAPPHTPAGPGRNIAPPHTPAGPGRTPFIAPPETPAAPMRARGQGRTQSVAPPATPAPLNAGASQKLGLGMQCQGILQGMRAVCSEQDTLDTFMSCFDPRHRTDFARPMPKQSAPVPKRSDGMADDLIVPTTPAMPHTVPVQVQPSSSFAPQTPAAITGKSDTADSQHSAPRTPAVLLQRHAQSQASKASAEREHRELALPKAPMTPAAIRDWKPREEISEERPAVEPLELRFAPKRRSTGEKHRVAWILFVSDGFGWYDVDFVLSIVADLIH